MRKLDLRWPATSFEAIAQLRRPGLHRRCIRRGRLDADRYRVCVFQEAPRSASRSLGDAESFRNTVRCICSRVPVLRCCCACCVAVRVAEGGDHMLRDAPGCGLPTGSSRFRAGAAGGAACEAFGDIAIWVVTGALAVPRSIRNDGSCNGAGNIGSAGAPPQALADCGGGALLSVPATGAPPACRASLCALTGGRRWGRRHRRVRIVLRRLLPC